MDASTFLRISSTARAVPVGRAPKNHRRRVGGGIDQPQKERGVNGGLGRMSLCLKFCRYFSKPGAPRMDK